jgi:REP element-mobilizing transposase RayT
MQGLADRFRIHVLESNTDPTDMMLLLSLRPEETVSACASKLKGQVSKWLRMSLNVDEPEDLLSRGYFASTSGKSTSEAVDSYLNAQGVHHGYAERPLPPVYVQSFDIPQQLAQGLNPRHACCVLKFHIVLATWYRHGVFVSDSAQAVTSRWSELQERERFGLLKVSFVPDHVHLAVQIHASIAPGPLAVLLMNAAQEVIFDRFSELAIRAKLERLWQPSAYVGSFGDLATAEIAKYMDRWKRDAAK